MGRKLVSVGFSSSLNDNRTIFMFAKLHQIQLYLVPSHHQVSTCQTHNTTTAVTLAHSINSTPIVVSGAHGNFVATMSHHVSALVAQFIDGK